MTRLWFVFVAWILVSPWAFAQEWPYHEPPLSVALLDREAIHLPSPLDEQLPEALLGIARNFQQDPAVTDRLRTMALAIVLQLHPKHRDALIVNHQLRRGLPPKVRGDYQTRDRVTTIVQATRAVLRDESDPNVVVLLAMLDDVASVWLSDKRLAPKSDPWQHTVPPAEFGLALPEVGLWYWSSRDRGVYVNAVGNFDLTRPFQVFMNGKPSKSLGDDTSPLKERLMENFPYRAAHAQIGFQGGLFERPWEETLSLTSVLASQLFDGHSWPDDWLWIGAEDRDDEVLRGSQETWRRLESFRDHEDRRQGVRVVVIPDFPEWVFEDWVIFGRDQLFMQCQVLSVPNLTTLIQLAGVLQEGQASTMMKRFADIGALVRTNRLEQGQNLLREIVQAIPDHVSARMLLRRLDRRQSSRASMLGSLRELRLLASPFLEARSDECDSRFVTRQCTPVLERLETMRHRFHLEIKPLVDAFDTILEEDFVNYCKNPVKNTKTSRREFSNLQRKLRAWERELEAKS